MFTLCLMDINTLQTSNRRTIECGYLIDIR